MPFTRLTAWQFRLASLLVAVAMMNMVIPDFAGLGSDDSCASTVTTVITQHNGIDERGSGSGGDPAVTPDDLDNSEPNSDNFDDCTLRSVTFSIPRGRYFGPITARSFIGQYPVPEHRPPDRR